MRLKMRRLQFTEWLALIPFTYSLATAASDLPQITPPPQLIQRKPGIESISVPGSVCGYISADYRSPIACSSGLSCSQYGGYPGQFNCCNSKTCYNDYTRCIGGPTTSSFSTCSGSDKRCLYCTGTSSECVWYTLSFGYNAGDYVRSVDCGTTATAITARRTPNNPAAITVNCVPTGFVHTPASTASCASQAVLLIPLIVSNVVVVAANIIMSRLKIQNRVKFCGKASTVDDKWTPWSGLSTVALVIVQAIASAALIRAGGYLAAWANLILLWLLRPRMQWSVMFLYSILGNQYQRSAKDCLFADGVLTLLGIPIAAWLLEAAYSSYACANDSGNTFNSYVLGFGTFGESGNTSGGLKVALYLCLAFSGVDLFIFAAFCVKRRLGRGWAVGAGIWSMMIFGISWYFWIAWTSFAGTDFCVLNVGAITAIHAVVPFISAIFRAWLN